MYIIILALFLSITGCAEAPKDQAGSDIIITYRDIPDITDEEIAAIESLKETRDYLSYGALTSTMAFTTPDGSYGGFTPKICELMSSLFGIEFVPKLYEWEGLMQELNDNAIDFTGDLTATSERREFYYMSHSIAEQTFSLFTHAVAKEINTEADLEGLRIGFLQGSITSKLISEKYAVEFITVEIPTHKKALEMLETGEIYGFVDVSSIDPYFADCDYIKSKHFFPLAYASLSLTTTNPELQPIISAMNKYIVAGGIDKLHKLYQDGEFEYAKYKLQRSFTDEEKAYLNALSENGSAVRVGHDSNNYPFDFYNETTGVFEGIADDVLTEISALTDIRFEPANTKEYTWTDVFEQLKMDEIPMVTELLFSDARKNDFLWPDEPYAASNYALLSKSDFPSLSVYQVVRARVGILDRTAYEDIYYQWFPDNGNTFHYKTADDGFEALENGEIDLLLMSEYHLLYQTHYREKPDYKINISLSSKSESIFGFNRNEEILCSIISKAQAFVNIASIETAWTNRTFDYSQKLANERAVYLTWSIAVLFLILVVTITLSLLTIRSKVRSIEALANDRHRLGALVKVADAGIIVKDENGIVQEWNIGAENILGYKPDEVIGKTTKFYSPESVHTRVDYMENMMRNGKSIVRMDVLRRHKDGSHIDCSASYTPYFDDNGRYKGSVAIFHDISEKKRMEQALRVAVAEAEEASKVKSTFLANMSHEIRTPMNAVIGMADLLLSENLTPKQRRYASDIKTSGADLLDVINDILDLSKIESGKLEIVPVDYDLMALLKNIDSMISFTAYAKHIAYLSEKDESLPRYLQGDDVRVRQILTNLLGNAVKFTTEGYVKLSARADDESVYFDVTDTGLGIRQEDMDKLFIAFQQVDTAMNRTRQGTGLGLSVTESLVHAMGGTITVESEYGKGSVFRVRIPRVDGDPANIKLRPETGSTFTAPDANILVVDDFEVNLVVAAGLLSLFDIECDTAANGETAIDMIQRKKYDIVFMDHMLPGMDGIEATQRIRDLGYVKERLPIIALTANAVKGVKETLLEKGMNDFLSKPIDKALLADMLIKWLPSKKVQIKSGTAPRTQTEEAAYTEALLKLHATREIDADAALALMGGSHSLYIDTMRTAVKRIPAFISDMTEYLRDANLVLFTIDIHSTKNMLATIGARSLSKEAADLESQSREGDEAFCFKMYPDFAGRLIALYEKLHPILFSEVNSETQPDEAPELMQQLERIISLLGSFDDNAALGIAEDLTRWDYGGLQNEQIAVLKAQIEMFEFDNAKARATSLVERLIREG